MARALVAPHFRDAPQPVPASALVQSRKLQKNEPSIRSAIRFNSIDSNRGPDHRLLRRRGDSGARGDGISLIVPWEMEPLQESGL